MKFAYLLNESILKNDNIKSIKDKLNFALLRHCRKPIIKKFSDIYDMSLNKIGEAVITLNRDKLSDDEIIDFFKENNIRNIIYGESDLSVKDYSLCFYDGSRYRFMKNIQRIKSENSANEEYLIIIEPNSSMEDILYIANSLRYINLFCEDRDFSDKAAKYLYEKSATTAGQIRRREEILKGQYKVISMDKNFDIKYDFIKDKVSYTDLFAPTNERYKVYLDVIGEFYLNDMYFDYLIGSKNK